MRLNRLERRFMNKRSWRKMVRTISWHWKKEWNAFERYISYLFLGNLWIHMTENAGWFKQGLFAFHMELALGYKLMSETFFEDEKCGIREIAYLQVTDPWYSIRKNSSYKEMFKIGQVFLIWCPLIVRANPNFRLQHVSYAWARPTRSREFAHVHEETEMHWSGWEFHYG